MKELLITIASVVLLVQIGLELVLWVIPADVPACGDHEITRGWYIAGTVWLVVQFLCAWIVIRGGSIIQ